MKSTEKCNSAKNSLQWLKNFDIRRLFRRYQIQESQIVPKRSWRIKPANQRAAFTTLFLRGISKIILDLRELLWPRRSRSSKKWKSQRIALGRYSIISLSQSGIFSRGKFFNFLCWAFLDVTLRGVVKIILDFSSGRETPHWPIGRAREKNLLSFLTYWMLSAELEFGFFAPREHQPKIEIS